MTLTKSNIGRWAVILHQNLLHVGTVIDVIAGTSKPKRIRVQRGSLQGKVLQPADYQFKNFIEDEAIDP